MSAPHRTAPHHTPQPIENHRADRPGSAHGGGKESFKSRKSPPTGVACCRAAGAAAAAAARYGADLPIAAVSPEGSLLTSPPTILCSRGGLTVKCAFRVRIRGGFVVELPEMVDSRRSDLHIALSVWDTAVLRPFFAVGSPPAAIPLTWRAQNPKLMQISVSPLPPGSLLACIGRAKRRGRRKTSPAPLPAALLVLFPVVAPSSGCVCMVW